MAWTLDGIRIFAQQKDDSNIQIVPRLQPLSGGTVHQFFGYEDAVTSLVAVVVGDTDKEDLEALARSGTSHTLVGPEGSFGNYIVKRALPKRQMVICQTIRTDLPEDSPVYIVDLELYKV